LTLFAASIGVGFGYGLWWAITHQGAALNVNSPVFENLITAVAMPAAAAMLVFAARRAGWSARDYLALVLPSWRQVLVGFGSLVAFAVALTGMSTVFHRSTSPR